MPESSVISHWSRLADSNSDVRVQRSSQTQEGEPDPMGGMGETPTDGSDGSSLTRTATLFEQGKVEVSFSLSGTNPFFFVIRGLL